MSGLCRFARAALQPRRLDAPGRHDRQAPHHDPLLHPVLSTFGDALGEVGLIPGTGGNFEIRVNGELIWERKRDGGFPGPKELKQRVRDMIEPGRDLGHIDKH